MTAWVLIQKYELASPADKELYKLALLGMARQYKSGPYVIAVDFDGTICKSRWPDVGDYRQDIISRIKTLRELGFFVILDTCREGENLERARTSLKSHGCYFDAYNENAPHLIEFYGNDCRKISANEYWDSNAVSV